MAQLVDLVKKLMESVFSEMNVAIPGKILTYDFKTQKARIKVDIPKTLLDGTMVESPVIDSVPVMFPISGGASITLPVKPGDTCMVYFTDENIKRWLEGGSGQQPETLRNHDWTDAVAVPGLIQFSNGGKAENNTDVLITYSGSNIRLKPDGKIDIHSAKEVNVKTEGVIINCRDATVNADNQIEVNCKNAKVTAKENIATNCQNLTATVFKNLKVLSDQAYIEVDNNILAEFRNMECNAKENIVLKPKISFVVEAKERVNISCREANVSAEGNVTVAAKDQVNIIGKDVAISSTENTKIYAFKGVSITAKQDVQITGGQNILIVANEESEGSGNITLECKKTVKIKSETVEVECKNATVTAEENITTKSVIFKHEGDFEVNGKVKVSENITIEGNASISGTATMGSATMGSATVNGAINATGIIKGSDVIAGAAVSLSTHLHISDAPGLPTGPPIL